MNFFADIAIIGGGASGLAAAITAKRISPSSEVYIFEALDRVGKKLITTGNGRCNLTNRNLSADRFHGESVEFAMKVMGEDGNKTIEEFFSSVGVPFVFEENKGFPSSLQASSVVDCLRFECDRLGVKTICNCKIDDIKFSKDFKLFSQSGIITAKTVIACTGLYSGGERLGSDGSFYRILKSNGFKTVKITPSIVQVKTQTDYVKQLKGIKTLASATLLRNDQPVKSEFGEVLFCDYGLSGPAIMNISRGAFRQDLKHEIALDLFPDTEKEELCKILISRAQNLSYRKTEDFFTGMLNKRLGQVVMKYIGLKLSDSVSIIDQKTANNLADALKCFKFKVTGNTGFVNSQVSAGGISTDEFNPDSLMSKKYPGFFACGELLDIDGDCGGFNLAWAWTSGMVAARSAAEFAEVKK
ncbi:MAG: aminoacetone oxidase family FAD-binding enzyme [Ruminococcaceae bacterium]|nr:aminoacetone oxidase family FAD-binding enzyme [Oscillospiraceae bacterium]